MKINIKPTVDCVFKALLGSKKHKNIFKEPAKNKKK